MHIQPHAQDYAWGVLHMISYHTSSFLAGTLYFFTVNVMGNQGRHYSSNQLHQMFKHNLKLAGAARGVPGSHGQQFFLIPVSYA